ncbi:FCD domain-containing protein [Paracoccus sediminis]|uniref:Pyruvate dehydrogenase complex repressor n=1 Tax=Paracoccus sediminis TaxID=1214787 RepID=A0A238VFD2_9RHOB|nr:FCD domain-containing protein [Paracoccus sediminis]TBN52009.1 FCD domain-containing protein [Paracoccus sediminis]SNR32921.1 transcriptional regulator, GntR family [Paracoccus sediminis]
MTDFSIRPERAADAVARHIENLILEGSLAPDEGLLPERDLAARLNVSRPTLRDGLKLLQDRGLLVGEKGRGMRVAALGRAAITDPLLALLAERPEVEDDCLDFRDVVESHAAGLAAVRATDLDRGRIGATLDRIDAAHAAAIPEDEAEADAALHQAIYEASHNLVLLQVMRALSGSLRSNVAANRARLFTLPQVRDTLRDQHRAIGAAILTRDADAARAAAHAHLAYVRQAARDLAEARAHGETARRRQSGGGLGQRG